MIPISEEEDQETKISAPLFRPRVGQWYRAFHLVLNNMQAKRSDTIKDNGSAQHNDVIGIVPLLEVLDYRMPNKSN